MTSIVDTVQALEAAHVLFSLALSVGEDTNEGKRLVRIAEAGFSATIPYLRRRSVRVQTRHAQAISTMIAEARTWRNIQ